MSSPIVCQCTDWEIQPDDDGRVLRLIPSWRTFRKNLLATLLAAMFLGGQWYFFGFPPGSAQLSAARDDIAERAAALEGKERQIRRLETSATDTGKQMAARRKQQLEIERARIKEARAELANAEPTLGTVGDTIYWSFFGLFVLLGVLPPSAVFWERITLQADGNGALAVKRRGQLVRSARFPAGTFKQMFIAVERIIHYSHRHHVTEDKGWRWAVRLEPGDQTHPPLVVCPEQEPSLPANLNKMTARVRTVVQFLSHATGVEPGPVIKSDVNNIRPGLFGAKARGTISRTGTADLSRKNPL